jgi:hypothetical protein
VRLLLQLTQAALLLAIAVLVGLRAAHAVHLGAPVLEQILEGRPPGSTARAALAWGTILGAAGAALVLAGDALVFAPRRGGRERAPDAPRWQWVLASLYGGITEEIYARLFVFSVFAWLVSRASPVGGALASWQLWLSNLVSAAVFGALHLPAARALYGLNALRVARVLVLNGIPSLLFGWLYWRHGLEASMVAHLCADLVLQGAGALRRGRR